MLDTILHPPRGTVQPLLMLRLEAPHEGDEGVYLLITGDRTPLPRLSDESGAYLPVYPGAPMTFPGQLEWFHPARTLRWYFKVIEWLKGEPQHTLRHAGLASAESMMQRHIRQHGEMIAASGGAIPTLREIRARVQVDRAARMVKRLTDEESAAQLLREGR